MWKPPSLALAMTVQNQNEHVSPTAVPSTSLRTRSSCLYFPSAEITDTCIHTYPGTFPSRVSRRESPEFLPVLAARTLSPDLFSKVKVDDKV